MSHTLNKPSLYPAAILAGGLATRLRPVTETIPKALIDINGEPFIAHQLRLLKNNGIERVVMCVGFLGEAIEAFVGNGAHFGLSVSYSYDAPENGKLLGTGGAIKKALPYLDENFFIIYGDSYLPCNYAAVQKAYIEQQRLSLMTVFHNQGLWDKSNVKYVDHRIIIYDKKSTDPELKYIDYGLGIFNQTAFNQLSENTPYDLADLYQEMLREGQLAAFEVNQRFYEIGSFTGITEICHFLKEETT